MNPSELIRLPQELLAEILLKLDLPSIAETCKTSVLTNEVCRDIWRQLLKRDFDVRVLDEPKLAYMKYRRILTFFGRMFPALTNLSIELIHDHVPEAWWGRIAEIYWKERVDNDYGTVLVAVTVLRLVSNYHRLGNVEACADDDFPVFRAIKTRLLNQFRKHIDQALAIDADQRLDLNEKTKLIEDAILRLRQTVYIRGRPTTSAFNYDLIDFFFDNPCCNERECPYLEVEEPSLEFNREQVQYLELLLKS